MWETFVDICGREALHMAGAVFIQKIAFHSMRFAQRRLRGSAKLEWITPSDKPVMLLSGLAPFLIVFWREPGDVAAGGWVVKSWIDGIFWLLFGLIGSFDTYRTKYKD